VTNHASTKLEVIALCFISGDFELWFLVEIKQQKVRAFVGCQSKFFFLTYRRAIAGGKLPSIQVEVVIPR
jgi:hypothetical protein